MPSNIPSTIPDTSSALLCNGKISTLALHSVTHSIITNLLLRCRIKTQDAILGKFATERLVEIGPAETLTNMASKTLDADYRFQDVALGVQREVLSYNRDAQAIYYDTSNQEAATPITTPSSASAVPATTVAAPAPAAPQEPVSKPDSVVATPAPAMVSIPDRAVSPHDIITTLVALALAKEPGNISQDQTLKALCGGR